MATIPSTVDVKCPRCDVPIVCTLTTFPASRPKPGKTAELVANVPDLADKFAAHYAAEHADAPRIGVDFIKPFLLDPDVVRAHLGVPRSERLAPVIDAGQAVTYGTFKQHVDAADGIES